MATKGCLTRLQKEYKNLQRDPVPHVTAHPTAASLLEWHFVLEGAPGTDFEGGVYHGKLAFPPNYPFKPPSISMVTPNGRFATNAKLCLSITDFHPESWNPMWSVGTILTGLLSFMYDNSPTTGSVASTPEERRRLAAASLAWNVERGAAFRRMFPEWVEEHARRQREQQQQQQQQQAAGGQEGLQQQQQVQGAAAVAAAADHHNAQQQQQQQQQRPREPAAAGARGAAPAPAPAAASGALAAAAALVLALAILAAPLVSSADARAALAMLRARLFA